MSNRGKVFVPFGLNYASSIKSICEPTTDIVDFYKSSESYDLILFTGGADVDPKFYNEESPKGLCQINPNRDAADQAIFEYAFKNGIKMAGICRGMQFLTAMCGGKLIHHLDNHSGSDHGFECSRDNTIIIQINSLHHQMCIPPKDGYIIGWSNTKMSKEYYGDKDELINWPGPEVEAVLIPDKLCVGVQYHPEMMDVTSVGYKWFHRLISDFLDLEMSEFKSLYTRGEKDVRFHSAAAD